MGKRTHGQRVGAPTRTYTSWCELRRRCLNPKSPSFADYGGRGITVCERWKSFVAFLEDMGERPEGTSLDRFPNNDGNYEPGNCRWATQAQQHGNTRRNAYIEICGTRRRVRDVELSLGLSPGAIWHRLRSGWSVEKACSTRSTAP